MSNFKFEPAVWKTAITGVVGLLAIWGFNASEVGEQLLASVDVLAILIPAVIALVSSVVGGLWVRPSVTPNVAVVERATKDGQVVAGEANSLVPEGEVVRAADEAPVVDKSTHEVEEISEPAHGDVDFDLDIEDAIAQGDYEARHLSA